MQASFEILGKENSHLMVSTFIPWQTEDMHSVSYDVARPWKNAATFLRAARTQEMCNVARNKNDVLQVAEIPCYTAQFFSNLQRNGVALEVAGKNCTVYYQGLV